MTGILRKQTSIGWKLVFSSQFFAVNDHLGKHILLSLWSPLGHKKIYTLEMN